MRQIKKHFLLQWYHFFFKKMLGFIYSRINALVIRNEKSRVIICPNLRVAQIVYFFHLFISDKLILLYFHLAFVAVVLVQSISSPLHSYNKAIIAPWQMANWDPKVQQEASRPQYWPLGQVTRWVASPDRGNSERKKSNTEWLCLGME